MGYAYLEGSNIHLAKACVYEKQDLEVALGVVGSNYVEVALNELAEPSFLWLLSTPYLAYVVSLEREGEACLVCGHIACKRDGEVEP